MLGARGELADAAPIVTRVGPALIVTLPRELGDAALHALRTSVMERVRESRTRALVFEASGLDVVDASEFRALAAVARSAAWLGVRPMLVGLTPGIVGYLVDAALDTSAFTPFGTLDDALAALDEGHAERSPYDAAQGGDGAGSAQATGTVEPAGSARRDPPER
jgi:anti-anti-sigma regulatory factor